MAAMLNDPITAPIYLDAQATERPHPAVIDSMMPYWQEKFGNPSAMAHERGRQARQALELARDRIAATLHAERDGVVFVAGATEANNLVLSSVHPNASASVIVSSIEHKSVLEAAHRLKERGMKVQIIRVDPCGKLDLDHLRTQLSPDTTLVSVMLANNEIGTIQPIAEVGELCRDIGARLHVDAAQAIGKVPVDFHRLGIDFLSLTGHKLGGPQGAGALICRPEHLSWLTPLVVGGGQEGGLRSGTVPIALCHGLSVAIEHAASSLASYSARVTSLREALRVGLESIGGFTVNGHPIERLPGNLNGRFEGIPALRLMRALPEIYFSVGSACTTGAATSHVLSALGLSESQCHESFRLSLSWATTPNEIGEAVRRFRIAVEALRFVRGQKSWH